MMRGRGGQSAQEGLELCKRYELTGRPEHLAEGTSLLVLEADLPGDAYSKLMALDLSQFSIGPLHYDQARHCWRSELDEAAAGPTYPR
jgi:hypothetical protein